MEQKVSKMNALWSAFLRNYEREKNAIVIFGSGNLCLDLGIGLLRPFFTLAINMAPAAEGIPSFRSSYFQDLNLW